MAFHQTCALILWRSGFGLLMGKFHQCLTELSACDTIMAGYYSLTFLFLWGKKISSVCLLLKLQKRVVKMPYPIPWIYAEDPVIAWLNFFSA